MSEPVLEWRRVAGYGDHLWEATGGLLTLRVRDRITHAQWDIEVRRICGDLHDAATVEAAQIAAESAALDLLLTAVAAFPSPMLVEADPFDNLNHLRAWHERGTVRVADHRDRVLMVDPDDAISLGRALICAALKARKETP